ncbi:MAG TPA: hypothetical protein VE986_09365 [Hyphomicrobiales bacterium]|nr:hypothetical protein [Hyphomicrobiales bacterium]
MPHLLVIAIGAVLLYAAFRWFRREYERVDSSLRRTERRIRNASSTSATPLTFDKAAGVYRPIGNSGS